MSKLVKFYGFMWEFGDEVLANGGVDLIAGPLCIRKRCNHSAMEQTATKHFECLSPDCDNKVDIDIEHPRLEQLARQSYRATFRRRLPVLNLDKLPSINADLEEENKFYKVSVEHDPNGTLKDVHILIGRRNESGKKVHIIVSPEGEIRFDKKDLPPDEEIKSISSIVFK